MQSFGKLAGPLLANAAFAVFHFTDVVLGDASQSSQLLLGCDGGLALAP